MFRRLIKENIGELKSFNNSISKIGKFQKNLDGNVDKILGQKIGKMNETLPGSKAKMDECLKKVGDVDLCAIVLTKYNNFYNQMCKATPALCDDHQLSRPTQNPQKNEPLNII